MIQDLKTWKEYFDDIVTGHKNFEVRKDDRGFKEGDTLILKEFDRLKKTIHRQANSENSNLCSSWR